MNLTSYSIVIFFPLIAYLTSIARGSHIGRKHRKARLESFQGWWMFPVSGNVLFLFELLKHAFDVWRWNNLQRNVFIFSFFNEGCRLQLAIAWCGKNLPAHLFCLVKIMALLKRNSTKLEHRKEVWFFLTTVPSYLMFSLNVSSALKFSMQIFVLFNSSDNMFRYTRTYPLTSFNQTKI